MLGLFALLSGRVQQYCKDIKIQNIHIPYLVILGIIFYHFLYIMQFRNQIFVEMLQNLPPEIS
jgi:hypothetical protein